MFRRVVPLRWQVMVTPSSNRGGKNLSFKPKLTDVEKQFVRIDMQHPRRRPEVWQPLEFQRLGYVEWPKQVGFWNAGDTFELTPEFLYRFFQHNHTHELWTQGHNEQTIIAMMPCLAASSQDATREQLWFPRLHEVFQSHVARFGADHVIYNAVMQAYAFAGNYEDALDVFQEMSTVVGLRPNAQSYVNMMFAVFVAKKNKQLAFEFYEQGVKAGVIDAVMRMDYEFTLWWKQFERLGTFRAHDGGFLACNVEGAKPRPRDMWAIWGWDRSERKFLTRKERIQQEIRSATMGGRTGKGDSIASSYRRRPWYRYKGMFPWDYRQHGGKKVQEEIASLYQEPEPPCDPVYRPCPPAY